MEHKLEESFVQEHHSELYKAMLEQAKKKDMKDGEWTYQWGVLLDNAPEPETKKEFIDDFKRRYGISLEYKAGRKCISELIYTREGGRDGKALEFPKYFEDLAIAAYERSQEKINLEDNQASNYDAILKSNGYKKGFKRKKEEPFRVGNGIQMLQHIMRQAQNKPQRYPTLEELENSHPEIIEKYSKMADGTQLVIFSPEHGDADEWGFTFHNVTVATKRLKPTRNHVSQTHPRFHDETGMVDVLVDNKTMFAGNITTHYALKVKPGEEFSGWRRTKQYRYSQAEIDEMIKGKIFESGGVAF